MRRAGLPRIGSCGRHCASGQAAAEAPADSAPHCPGAVSPETPRVRVSRAKGACACLTIVFMHSFDFYGAPTTCQNWGTSPILEGESARQKRLLLRGLQSWAGRGCLGRQSAPLGNVSSFRNDPVCVLVCAHPFIIFIRSCIYVWVIEGLFHETVSSARAGTMSV